MYIKFNNRSKIYNVSVIPQGNNVVTLKFRDEQPEVNTSGFHCYADASATLDVAGDTYTNFDTVYRNDDVTAGYNGYQLSNDGSHYTPSRKNVVVKATWEDNEDAKGFRPDSMEVTVLKNGEEFETRELNVSNNYTITYENVLDSDRYTIEIDDVNHYNKTINGTTVNYVLNIRDIVVSVEFMGDYTTLPNSVDVDVFNGDTLVETLTLNDSNNWKHTYVNIPVDTYYSVNAEDIDGFNKTIYGTTVTYEYISGDLETRVSALEAEIQAIDNAIGGMIE